MKSDLGEEKVCYVIEGRLPRALRDDSNIYFVGGVKAQLTQFHEAENPNKSVFVLPMFLIHMEDNLN